MTDDAVVIPPGGGLICGKDELDTNFARMRQSMVGIEVLEYELDFEEVPVLGDYAYEWGWIKGSMRAKDSSDIARSTYRVMRILKRQPDGEWKVHRTIWNEDSK